MAVHMAFRIVHNEDIPRCMVGGRYHHRKDRGKTCGIDHGHIASYNVACKEDMVFQHGN